MAQITTLSVSALPGRAYRTQATPVYKLFQFAACQSVVDGAIETESGLDGAVETESEPAHGCP